MRRRIMRNPFIGKRTNAYIERLNDALAVEFNRNRRSAERIDRLVDEKVRLEMENVKLRKRCDRLQALIDDVAWSDANDGLAWEEVLEALFAVATPKAGDRG